MAFLQRGCRGFGETLSSACRVYITQRSLTGMNGCLMVQRQKTERRKGRLLWLWSAGWQAAKKALSHSPYVTCFPSASAVRICYQPAPAARLSGLNGHFFPPYLFLSLPFAESLCPVFVMWMLSLAKGKVMHDESMACSNTHKQNSHPLMSAVLSCFHIFMFQRFFFPAGGRILEVFFFVLAKGLGSDV